MPFIRPVIGGNAPSLLTGLNHYYPMQEATHNPRIDSVGTFDLGDSGITSAHDIDGKIDACVQINVGGLLTSASPPTTMKLAGDRTFVFWFRNTNAGDVNGTMLAIDQNVGSNREFLITRNHTSGFFGFLAWDDTDTLYQEYQYPVGGIVQAQWYMLVFTYSVSKAQIGISVDAGAFTYQAVTSSMNVGGSASFDLGSSAYGGTNHTSADYDELGVWGRELEAVDISWLHNGGAGRALSEFT